MAGAGRDTGPLTRRIRKKTRASGSRASLRAGRRLFEEAPQRLLPLRQQRLSPPPAARQPEASSEDGIPVGEDVASLRGNSCAAAELLRAHGVGAVGQI